MFLTNGLCTLVLCHPPSNTFLAARRTILLADRSASDARLPDPQALVDLAAALVAALVAALAAAADAMEVDLEDLTEDRAQTMEVTTEVIAVAMAVAAEEIAAATVAAATMTEATMVVITTAEATTTVVAQVGMVIDLTVAAVDVEAVEAVMMAAEAPTEEEEAAALAAAVAVATGTIAATNAVIGLTKAPTRGRHRIKYHHHCRARKENWSVRARKSIMFMEQIIGVRRGSKGVSCFLSCFVSERLLEARDAIQAHFETYTTWFRVKQKLPGMINNTLDYVGSLW
jgi:hypothetical protein